MEEETGPTAETVGQLAWGPPSSRLPASFHVSEGGGVLS